MNDRDEFEYASPAALNLETAKVPWRELQRFFANGSTVAVAAPLDLLTVAAQFAADDKTSVQAWMSAGQLGKVADAQALAWFETDALVWSVVVKPWVLVQAVEPS